MALQSFYDMSEAQEAWTLLFDEARSANHEYVYTAAVAFEDDWIYLLMVLQI